MIVRTVAIGLTGMVLGILQSTFLARLLPGGIIPDLALIFLVAAAWRCGALIGEVTGFIIGLVLDAMSLAPLGFHTAIFSLIGYIFGKFQDNVGPGKFFLPAIFLLGATVLKYGVAFLLTAVFGFHSLTARFFSLNTLWEAAINLLLAPFVFPLVNKVAGLLEGKRGGFH